LVRVAQVDEDDFGRLMKVWLLPFVKDEVLLRLLPL
jgi:hypothetical protein